MRAQGEIKSRIKSVKQTRQITKAMHMISIAKMKRALSMYESNLAYYQRVRAAIKDILAHSPDISHPFLQEREGKNAAYVIIAGDKGLAGSYNHDICRLALAHMHDKEQPRILTVGQEAKVFFEKQAGMVDIEFLHIAQNPSLYNARLMAGSIINLFNEKAIDEFYIAYTRFHSTTRREPRIVRLLPVEILDFENTKLEFEYSSEINYLPSPRQVLDRLIPQFIIGSIYGMLTHSYASEHSARMLAMESSTKNADEMLDKLQLEFNRARQSAITQELQEIIGGAEALGGFESKKVITGNLR